MEIGLNTDIPYPVTATDMAIDNHNHQEIGIGSESQSLSPTDSNSLCPPKLCSIEGCGREHVSKGYCDKHYRRWRTKILNEKANNKCACGCGKPIGYNATWSRGHLKQPHKLAQDGSKNPRWKGGILLKKGYVFIHTPDHPNAFKNYVREHHLVIEKDIGRFLTKGEIVHHINMIKNDNRIENLWLCNKSSHHKAQGSIFSLVKQLLDDEIIVFDREKGRYIMKEEIK